MDNSIKCRGELNLNGLIIPCYVLEDGTRVLSATDMQKALGVTGNEPNQRSSKRLDEILTSKHVTHLISEDNDASKIAPIECYDGNKKINGFIATTLPDVCDLMLKLRDYANSNNIKLGIRQQAVIIQADIIIRSLAKVGIIALVDEATGYQYEREHFELQKILSTYVSDEILKWQLTFTDDFYYQIFRLWGIPYTAQYIKRKPKFISKLTRKYVYDELPDVVIKKIQEQTPKSSSGNYIYRWHQSLTPEVGKEHLKKQIIEVTTLMSISKTKQEFDKLFKQKYGKEIQLELEFKDEYEPQQLSAFNSALKKGLEYNPKYKK